MSKRLPGVDGLRAVAALWVVLFHMVAFSTARFPQVPGLDLFLRSGSTGVSLFLVLSGFCLYLPFAAGRTGRFNAREFFRRRCQRLMPAYYVSLVAALALAIATAEPLREPPMSVTESLFQLLTHASLLHTLFPTTFYSLNGAFWSLGLEWQLYLAMPVLVWLTFRFGLPVAFGVAVACNLAYRLALAAAIGSGAIDASSLIGSAVLPNQLFGRWGEFAFGMVAAELHASGRLRQWARFVPGMLAVMAGLVPLSLLASSTPFGHLAYGALFFTLVCVVVASDNSVARLLAWRPLVAIGTLSYSLYLVHQPVLQVFGTWVRLNRPDSAPNQVFFAMLLAVFPCILALAWLLFIFVERRTLTSATADTLMPRLTLPWLSSAASRRPRIGGPAIDSSSS